MRYYPFLALCVFCCLCPIVAEEQPAGSPATTEVSVSLDPPAAPAPTDTPHYGRAVALSIASNLTLLGVNRYIRRALYATELDFDAIRHNLLSAWVWDNDGFTVNQIGHPYQGSFYYVAGRSNGLGFLPSTLLAAVNSVLWEYTFETETPSVNDLIVTAFGGASTGEVLHRLYVDARVRGLPLAAALLISPMDAVSDLVSRRGRPSSLGDTGEITALSLALGPAAEARALDTQREGEENGLFPAGLARFDIVYGEPFGLNSVVPYEHFELSTQVSWSPAGYFITLLTDGSIVSMRLPCREGASGSLSLSLHYDFILGPEIRLSSHALGIGVKRSSSIFSLRAHLAWVLLGGSDYVNLTFGPEEEEEGHGQRRMYDFGTGACAKVDARMDLGRVGAFSLQYAVYWFYTLPPTVLKPDGSEGHALTGLAVASYEFPIAHGFSIGIMDSFCHKTGWYDDARDVFEWVNSASLFVRKRFI